MKEKSLNKKTLTLKKLEISKLNRLVTIQGGGRDGTSRRRGAQDCYAFIGSGTTSVKNTIHKCDH